jgi:membrane-associated protease RseP (regulator of RpoE activity)
VFPGDLTNGARALTASDDRAISVSESQTPRFEPPGRYVHAPSKQRVWLHLLLLVATLFTTTLVGAHMQFNFAHNLPFFDIEHLSDVFTIGLRSPQVFFGGLPFSLTLLTILMAHELGHYLVCVYYGIDASLPYFLPSPMPVTGTFGAFIRIRSLIPKKKILFDIGIAGPLAGFVFLVPALGVGLAFSKVVPGIEHRSTIQLGVPFLEKLAQRWVFPGVPASDIYLHPVARAAWVGMFATALNLLPVGQLDGGHVVYALLGRFHKWITNFFLVLLIPMGMMWNGWWFWAVMLFLFARKHPPLYDETAIGSSRIKLGLLGLFVFLLCFSLAPIND